MKKFLVLAIALSAAVLTGCTSWDRPEISFYQESYTVSAQGGEVIIPVNHTGISDATISFRLQEDNFEDDQSTGDLTPIEGWCKITKIINRYEPTRDLAMWDSGILLSIEPNNKGAERTATLTVYSFNISESILIKQGF